MNKFRRQAVGKAKAETKKTKVAVLLTDTIGALIITYTILGVPYYNYSIMGLKTLL